MKINLYEVLGVAKDAELGEIKKAYRDKAKEHHPDMGGDAEEFKKVQLAWEVLSNRAKRDEYDSTGSYDEKIPENFESKMMTFIDSVIIPNLIHNTRGSFEKLNLLQEVKNIIQACRDKSQAASEHNSEALKKLELFIKRVKHKETDENPVKSMFDLKIDAVKKLIEAGRIEQEFLDKSDKLFDEFECEESDDIFGALHQFNQSFKSGGVCDDSGIHWASV